MNTSRRWLPRFLLVFALALALAPQLSAQEKKARRNSNRITTEEVQAATQTDAFSLVQSLRPHWFRVRGPSSINRPSYVKVYQDGMLIGGVEALRRINRGAVASAEYLDAPSATQRYGTDHASGAILVRTAH